MLISNEAAPKFGAARSNAYSIAKTKDTDDDDVNNDTGYEEDGVFCTSQVGKSNMRGSFVKEPAMPASMPRTRPYLNVIGTCFPDTACRRYRQRHCKIRLDIAAVVIAAVVLCIAILGGEKLVINHTGYKVLKKIYIPEVQGTMVLYKHIKTHAQVLTLVPDDATQDAVFGVSVRTLPENNGGAAHVLMESLWDGSEGYPLKDPVHEYYKGSLATHLEAACLGDRTVFTAASRQRSDFSNLVSLLLDSIFQPLVTTKPEDSRWIFREEGWRLDPGMEFNGVVLNRQKAIYSDPEELLHRYARKALYPDNSLQFDAQGSPSDILDLRPIDVLRMYVKYYTPTNIQVFLYGPIEEIFDGMHVFDSYAKTHEIQHEKKSKSTLQLQPLNLKSPVEETHDYPHVVDIEIPGDHILMSWVLNEYGLTRKEEYAWRVIDHLLLRTPTSILREGLEDVLDLSNFNQNITAAIEVFGGLDTSYQQWRFSVGAKGLRHNKTDTIFDIIPKILAAIEEFEEDALTAAMNVVEMERYDMSSGKLPRGVRMFRRVLEHWTYGISPYDSFAFSKTIQELKDEIRDNGSTYFISLLQRSLVKNAHMVKVELNPQEDNLSKMAKAEKERIKHLQDVMSADEFQKLLDESIHLEEVIATPDSSEMYDNFPRLDLKHVDASNSPRSGHLKSEQSGVLLATNVVPSSFGMVYVDFGLDMSNVNYDDVPFLPLIFRIMLEAGTSQYTKSQLINRIGQLSTGIVAEAMITDVQAKDYDGPLQFQVHDGQHLATKMVLRGRCMAKNLKEYLNLLAEIAFHGRGFDKYGVIEVLNRMIREMESKVEENGPEMVARRLASRYSSIGMVEEQLYGFSQLTTLHNLLKGLRAKWQYILAKLVHAQAAIIEGNRNGMFLSITTSHDLIGEAKSIADDFIANSIPTYDFNTPYANPGEVPHPWIPKIRASQPAFIQDEALIVATPVNHIGKGGLLYNIGDPVSGSAAVVARYLQKHSLYEKLRERRGVGAVKVEFDFRHGTMFLMTEDDIHVVTTLDVMNGVANDLMGAINRIDYLPVGAKEAIVGAIGEWDGTAKQPDQIGWDFMVAYYRDENADFEQLYRDQILSTSRQDFVDFVDAFKDWKQPSVAMVSSAATYLSVKNDLHFRLIKPICQQWKCKGLD